ncbi:hypothetical protein CTI12_AA180840 [Artemisia annua]|uniref:Helitron helicase-like domain-containing protein n=1 Tax=Artemisia annua TaxID=35608 RepID=A0A2U1P8T0_ARTAN|nr:hypothetical protein CTI12_AA180840 [Artemisia annua]
MREKRKAVPNRDVQDMREQTPQCLGSQIPYHNGVSVSIPVDGLGVTHVGGHGMIAGVSAVVDAGIRSGALGSSNFRGFIPGLSSTDTSTMGVSVTGAASPILNSGSSLHTNRPSLSSSADQCQLEFPVSVPVQVPNVDGSVSAFGTHSVINPSYVGPLQPQIVAGQSMFPNNPGLGHTPMVLDFSTGCVIRVSDPASSDPGSDAQQRPTPARPSRRAANLHTAASDDPPVFGPVAPPQRQANLHTAASDDPPVFGPVAPPQRQGAPLEYKSFGRCDRVCQHCGAVFWLEERRAGLPMSMVPQYQRCCAGGRAVLRSHNQHPAYITQLFADRHFMENIRAYNQMFAMTSFGATIDNSLNTGRGPYIFRVSGQIYHWIGGFCPAGDDIPRFLQLYIYDTEHEVRNRLSHFEIHERHALREPIIQGLIEFLDSAPLEYKSFGRCDRVCQHCGAVFWLEERRAGLPMSMVPQYQRCCAGGRAVLRSHNQHPAYITQLFADRHFMENIRAYNQMFAMTSFGATIDNSLNTGRGPYIFRVSGQIYHWIGGFCPAGDDIPRFLQLYIYDTEHEVRNRLSHFEIHERHALREPIIQGLIEFLDSNNALVKLFRTARDKLREADIPNFSIRLFGVVGSNQYELPAGDGVGAIVYEGGPETATDYDVVIERHSGEPESVQKHGW